MKNIFILGLLALLFVRCEKDTPQAEIDDRKIQEYLAENNIDAQKDEISGVYYVIYQEGIGGHPNIYSTVTVSYKGYLTDGFVFDSTKGTNFLVTPLSSLIRGWQYGLPYFQKGGRGLLIIPSTLGYGDAATGGDSNDDGEQDIPKNSILLFDFNLVTFK